MGHGKDLGFPPERSGVLLRNFKKRGDMGDVKIDLCKRPLELTFFPKVGSLWASFFTPLLLQPYIQTFHEDFRQVACTRGSEHSQGVDAR